MVKINKILMSSAVIIGLFSLNVLAGENTEGVGITAIKDIYTKKSYVLEVIPSSSADVVKITPGAEIISINNKKVKKLSEDEINALLNGENSNDVDIKIKYNKQKTNYLLKKANYDLNYDEDEKFLLYWRQVAPGNLYLKKIPQEVLAKLSEECQNDILNKQGFWIKQKEYFKKGYDACLTYPEEEQNTCLLNLVNTINSNISRNQQLKETEDSAVKQQDGIPVYNVNQIMLQNTFQNFGNRY